MSSIFKLSGKTAIVTGASRGLGGGIAIGLAEAGADIVGIGISDMSEVQEKVESLGRKFYGITADFSDLEAVKQSAHEAIKLAGKIDILVNNAGMSSSTKIEDYTVEEYDKIADLNMKGVFICSKEIVSYLKETKGNIINISSMVSIYGQPAGCVYPMSKFAVNGLTKSLSRELAPVGVRVNAVAPGITKTDMVASLPDEMIKPLIATIPLGRIGEPKDIANACLFLASDMASYVTGEIMQVDGGARA